MHVSDCTPTHTTRKLSVDEIRLGVAWWSAEDPSADSWSFLDGHIVELLDLDAALQQVSYNNRSIECVRCDDVFSEAGRLCIGRLFLLHRW